MGLTSGVMAWGGRELGCHGAGCSGRLGLPCGAVKAWGWAELVRYDQGARVMPRAGRHGMAPAMEHRYRLIAGPGLRRRSEAPAASVLSALWT
eukprot:5919186-Prymnesium_polylepis.1